MKETPNTTENISPTDRHQNPPGISSGNASAAPDVSSKLASLLRESPEHSPNEVLAIHLSSGHDFHNSKPEELVEAENNRREKDLSKFLQRLSQVDTFHPKIHEKIMIAANKTVGKAPGVRTLPVVDQKAVTHAVLAAASRTGLKGLQNVIQHVISQRKKHKTFKSHIEAVFEGKTPEIEGISPKDVERVKQYIDSDGITEQLNAQGKYAEGGEVKYHKPLVNDHIAMHFPEHAMLSAAAKTRAHGYLNSLKPQPKASLPFDMNKDQSQEEKTYHGAIHMALRPMSILKDLRNGSMTLSNLKHLSALHPELYDLMKKELTSKITEMQLQGKKPSSVIRQGLSLFVGAPLEQNLNPASIQAIQAVFAPKPPAPAQDGNPNKVKKGTAPLSKFATPYRTPEQARDERADKT